MEDPGKKAPQYIAALAATGGALAAGTILAWTSPTSSAVKGGDVYDFEVSDEAFSWVASLTPLGAACVCIPIGFLANLFGRKWTMLGLVVPFTIGWACLIWAQNLGMLLFARFLLGVAGGAFCVTAPMYTGEIAQASIRGALGSYFQLMVVIGILVAYAVGAGVSTFVLSLICGVIPLVFGVIFFFMPESPVYLVRKTKIDEALSSLQWLRGSSYDSQGELEILKQEDRDRDILESGSGAWNERATKMASFIAIGLMIFQQFSGINAVIFFTTDIFAAADTGIKDSTATIIVGVVQVVATFISTLVVDKLGRRILLLQSALIMGICQIALAVYFQLQNNGNDVSNLGFIPIVALCIFIVAFSLGFGPIPWLICGEVFSPSVKGLLSAVAGTTNWGLAFLVTKFFENVVNWIGRHTTFYIFAGGCAVGLVFVWFVVPETKGLTLTEIQRMLNGEKIQRNNRQESHTAKA